MAKYKKIRTKGKIKLSKMFQEFKSGDNVILDRELSLGCNFHRRIGGKVGIVIGKRGKAYIIKIKEYNKEKQIIVNPVHLKKL